MRTLTVYHLRTFITSAPNSGALATVCVLDKHVSVKQMKSIAGAMKSQETGFLIANNKEVSLRWFSTDSEVQFCGTGLLGAAHVLEQLRPQPWTVKTKFNGTVTLFKNRSCLAFSTSIDKPVQKTPPKIIKKVTDDHGGAFYKSSYDWLIELDNEKEVNAYKPNVKHLKKWSGKHNRGLIVTAKTNKGCVSRFFAPVLSANENFTGSIHRVLAAYWQPQFKGPILAKQIGIGEGMAYCTCKRGRVTISGKVKQVKKTTIIVE